MRQLVDNEFVRTRVWLSYIMLQHVQVSPNAVVVDRRFKRLIGSDAVTSSMIPRNYTFLYIIM